MTLQITKTTKEEFIRSHMIGFIHHCTKWGFMSRKQANKLYKRYSIQPGIKTNVKQPNSR